MGGLEGLEGERARPVEVASGTATGRIEEKATCTQGGWVRCRRFLQHVAREPQRPHSAGSLYPSPPPAIPEAAVQHPWALRAASHASRASRASREPGEAARAQVRARAVARAAAHAHLRTRSFGLAFRARGSCAHHRTRGFARLRVASRALHAHAASRAPFAAHFARFAGTRLARASRASHRAAFTRLLARFALPRTPHAPRALRALRAASRGLARFARLVLFARFARLRARFARPRAFRALRALRAKPRVRRRAHEPSRARPAMRTRGFARLRTRSFGLALRTLHTLSLQHLGRAAPKPSRRAPVKACMPYSHTRARARGARVGEAAPPRGGRRSGA